MRFFIFTTLFVSLLTSIASASDQIPGATQTHPIAIVGATIHTVSGNTIKNGSIVFDKGRIVQVGKKVDLPKDCKVIKATGKHVYPSMIEANSDIGLVEINSLKDTIDSREFGSLNPNVKTAVAFNPDSELIPVARANGILLAITSPKGGLLSGRSSLMMLDGWTWEDMTLKSDTGMHVQWSTSSKSIQQLVDILDQTRRYIAARKSPQSTQPVDLRLEALIPVVNRKLPLIVSANSLSQIEGAVAFARRQTVKIIISGGYDAPHCAKLLQDENVPVIIGAVYRTPQHRHGAYDEGYTLPKQLQDAGIPYCISAGGRFGASMIRNLPYNAATAAAYGLTEKEALRSITLSPAEILGVADRVGSLQVGRDATLFIADGNILETPTQVLSAFIQGRKVDLDNRHKQLNRKYSIKYKRLQN
ncbi:MAG: imidazolonepropionase [Blastopirellula sp.]|nr:MAG: imidazolonepropionase [Blastopirellula sp.]